MQLGRNPRAGLCTRATILFPKSPVTVRETQACTFKVFYFEFLKSKPKTLEKLIGQRLRISQESRVWDEPQAGPCWVCKAMWREVLRPLGVLGLKRRQGSLKKIDILYTSYAALGGGGEGVSHSTSSWDCCLPAGSLARPAAHVGAGHHLLLREGKLKSSPNPPRPEVRGLEMVTVCQDSRRKREAGFGELSRTLSPPGEQSQEGEGVCALASQPTGLAQGGSSAACCCFNCRWSGCCCSPCPHLWVYPAAQKGWKRVTYLFCVLEALTQQARLSSSVRREEKQGLSPVGPPHHC